MAIRPPPTSTVFVIYVWLNPYEKYGLGLIYFKVLWANKIFATILFPAYWALTPLKSLCACVRCHKSWLASPGSFQSKSWLNYSVIFRHLKGHLPNLTSRKNDLILPRTIIFKFCCHLFSYFKLCFLKCAKILHGVIIENCWKTPP